MNQAAILAAIPHREPFLFIDEIVELTNDSIACRKTFAGDELFFQGHYPDFPVVPGVLLCEAGMQAGALLLAHLVEGTKNRVPVATRMNDVRFKRMVRPGDTIEIDVKLRERLADAYFLNARLNCEGKIAARFDFACTLAAKG